MFLYLIIAVSFWYYPVSHAKEVWACAYVCRGPIPPRWSVAVAKQRVDEW